jgi:hypothetical protein
MPTHIAHFTNTYNGGNNALRLYALASVVGENTQQRHAASNTNICKKI